MPAKKKVKAESNQLNEQQNRAENPLRETLSRIETVIKNTPAATQSLDRKELIRHLNTACRLLDGSTAAQAVEHRFQDTTLAEHPAGQSTQMLEEIGDAGQTAAPQQGMVHARTGREQLRKTGIELIADAPWGMHFCQFYQTKQDLIDILVPYFKAGLENNEFCMWVTSEPLNVEAANRALKKKVKNLDDYIKKGQLEILDHSRWYTRSGNFDSEEVLRGWVAKERQALKRGFDGLRLTGNTFWLGKRNWSDFNDYEAVVNSVIGKYRMLAICTYCLDKCTASEIIDVVVNHQFALIKQNGKWKCIESSEHKRAEEKIAQLAKFPDENPNPVLRISRGGTILYSNRAGVPLLNLWQCRDGLPLSGRGHQCVLRALDDGLPRQDEVECGSRTFSLTFAPVVDSSYVNVYALDITEHKRAEAMLQASENKFRDLIETTTDWVWEVDAEGTYTYVSPKVTELLGYDVNDVLGKTPFDFMPKEEADKVAKIFKEKVIRKEPFYRLENVNRHKEGHLVVLETSGIPLLGEEGRLEGYRGIDRDITDRKDIEARQILAGKILERLNKEGELLEVIRDVVALVKKSTGFEAVGIRLPEGDDFPYFAVEGFPVEFVEAENYLCARDRNGKLIRDRKGKAFLECMCGNILSGRTDPAFPFFTEGGSFWTNSTTKLLGSTSEKDRQARTRNRCNQAGYESVALIPLRSTDHIVGLLQLNDTWPGRFTPEMIRFFEAIGNSIAIALARIKAEEQAANLAKFPSENPFPVLRIARNGNILYSNAPALPLLEQWNRRVGESVPEHWNKLVAEVLDSNRNKITELKCDGRIISFVIAPVTENDYVNVYGRDVTKGRRAEQKIRELNEQLEKRVVERTARVTRAHKHLLKEIEERKCLEKELLNISEREQRLIGQELHDSIGQQFAGIAFMAKALEQKLASKLPDEAANAAEIVKLVNQATDQARDLAKGLHPVDLDAGSLLSALRELAAATEHLFGIRCTFKADEHIPIDDTTVAIHLYRITQEAITNAIKHSRAKNITIALTSGSNKSVLMVKSDGLDFPEVVAKGTGMGLQIMDHRAEMIHGSLNIHRSNESGTILTCVFPNRKH